MQPRCKYKTAVEFWPPRKFRWTPVELWRFFVKLFILNLLAFPPLSSKAPSMTRHVLLLFLIVGPTLFAADRSLDGNPELANYFENEVTKLEQQNSLLKYKTLEEWEQAKPKLRADLFDMLGMNPLPERTPLDVKITGTVEHEDFIVEKLHFQSMPGLYVTGNFYRPKKIEERLPTVLYVCGHARVRDGDISFGNKAGYQHHGAWFARNGYTCLTIDTIQLGEILGIHHGTYRHNRWWWNSRGYSPAGVEAWNCMRALDYLETRPEVDKERFGVTGRSGGGAYSWWISALDDRIKCAIPVAGITNLRNHVVDGCVEGHCDCMYMVNTYRWDYAKVAALVAPRPLLISNSDKDSIFPLEGVVAVHREVRHIYDLYEKPRQLGLHITEGPHKDTQELRIHAFRWLNRWLKNDEGLISITAEKLFEPAQLKVFETLPADERVTSIDEDFAPQSQPADARHLKRILDHQKEWTEQSLADLKNQSFAAWPKDSELPTTEAVTESKPLKLSKQILNGDQSAQGMRLHFESQASVPLFVDVIVPVGSDAGEGDLQSKISDLKAVKLVILNDQQWNNYKQQCLAEADSKAEGDDIAAEIKEHIKSGSAVAVFCPRGVGPHAWTGDERKQIQIRRRFQLIGTTADAMRVWDIRSALSLLRAQSPKLQNVVVEGEGTSGWLALTAILFSGDGVEGQFSKLNTTRDEFPIYLNASRTLAPADFVALALRKSRVRIDKSDKDLSQFIDKLANNDRWTGQR
ncbi:Acetyl xylan esterase (AXE1) [Fuerstiella marisgermanici]|uniref:Acetyl xylan esterase (AXE1) n=2 Tax=Fuerstiella marisgermanici TaxID=1891926 RepID=A0A1P8W9S9_9PLAN|nr:Acetyl xylan esterase (AXE1) [Fuerstiella marisgermanici]